MTQFEYHNAANDESAQKKSLAWMLAQASAGKATTGVLSGLGVTQTTTASSAVNIAAGAGVVQAATLDGASLLVNDTSLSLDILTANPLGGLPRNDIVVFDLATLTPGPGSGGGAGGLRAIIGTPNASPTDPTIPTSAIPLARIRNLASATTIPSAQIDSLQVVTNLFNVEAFGPWVTLPINTAGGWSAGSPAPQARLIPGGRVELRGALVGGASITRNDPIPMPAQFVPAASRHLPTVRTTSSVAGKAMAIGVFVDNSGAFTFGYTDPAGLPTSVGYPVVGTYSL